MRANLLLALTVWFVLLPGFLSAQAVPAEAEPGVSKSFPANAHIIDVAQPPYNAKGDGTTDDTIALQKAMLDAMGTHKVLYVPNGTYLISDTLKWANKSSQGKNAYGFIWLQGENVQKTIFRLKDSTFVDAKKPKAILWCGGFGSADWFHNYVQDLTFEVGTGNPGAIGLQFYSNNTGAVRNCKIVSQDGQGQIGLDLGHRDMNGPLLVRSVQVKGFRYGILTARAVNSQTFEDVQLTDQKEVGFDNNGQSISIRRLKSRNAVPAIRTYGTLSLLDSTLEGVEGAKNTPAILNYNGGRIGLRDIKTTGYARAVADVVTPDSAAAYRITGVDKAGSEGPDIAEYFSHAATSPFAGPGKSLRLPIEETPDVPWDDPKSWAIVDRFGADPSGKKDSSAAIQKAIDSGATTVFFSGFYSLSKPIIVRGKVRRLLGTGGWIDYNGKTKPDFIFADGTEKVVVLEHFSVINGGVEIATDRTVVLRSLEPRRISHKGKGALFLEDVATDQFAVGKDQKVWARQLNVENQGTHVTNDGGKLWVLGYKTERGGTLLHTKNGGESEIFGTFSYTTTAGKLAPMFVTENASAFAFFNEVCFSNDPFTREVPRGSGTVTPYIGTAPAK
jgi:Pectate lyase superfamily protein